MDLPGSDDRDGEAFGDAKAQGNTSLRKRAGGSVLRGFVMSCCAPHKAVEFRNSAQYDDLDLRNHEGVPEESRCLARLGCEGLQRMQALCFKICG